MWVPTCSGASTPSRPPSLAGRALGIGNLTAHLCISGPSVLGGGHGTAGDQARETVANKGVFMFFSVVGVSTQLNTKTTAKD